MTAPYIPPQNPAYDAWLDNFQTLIAAAPTDYGLIAGDATTITAAFNAWHTAYVLATTPETRTSPAIAEMAAQRIASEATVRPYAQQIARNAAVSDLLKTGLGLNLPNPTRPPIPAPTTQPVLTHVQSNPGTVTLRYADVTTPTTKAKPAGVTHAEVRRTIGTAPAVAPDDADFVDLYAKSPFSMSFDSGDVGKIVTVWARWRTRSGNAGVSQFGPWSAALSFGII